MVCTVNYVLNFCHLQFEFFFGMVTLVLSEKLLKLLLGELWH